MSTPDLGPAASPILLCPGPVMLSDGVRAALADCEIGHRDSDFSELLERLRRNCRGVFGAGDEHSVVFIGGPATAALEASLSSLVPAGSVVVVGVNGAFGQRLAEILRAHGVRHQAVDFGFGRAMDLGRLEAAARAASRGGPAMLALAHHETSAGLLNPVAEVGALARRLGVPLFVDATSSAGAEALDVARDGVAACVTTSGKCLHGTPGVGLVCVRRDLLEATRAQAPRTYSLDLHRYHRQLEANLQTPFTPPVAVIRALDRAVAELLEGGGVAGRSAAYRRRRALVVEGARRLGLPILPLPPGREASAIVTVGVPAGVPFEQLYTTLKSAGYLVYGCKAPLAPDWFQVAVMGELPDAALHGFLEALRRIVAGASPRPLAAARGARS